MCYNDFVKMRQRETGGAFLFENAEGGEYLDTTAKEIL